MCGLGVGDGGGGAVLPALNIILIVWFDHTLRNTAVDIII